MRRKDGSIISLKDAVNRIIFYGQERGDDDLIILNTLRDFATDSLRGKLIMDENGNYIPPNNAMN